MGESKKSLFSFSKTKVKIGINHPESIKDTPESIEVKYTIDKEFSEVLDDYKEGNDKEMSESERKAMEEEQKLLGKHAEEFAIK